MKEKIKNWLKENWFKVGLITILVISIAGAFYWFEYRPTKIKERCSADAHFDTAGFLNLGAFGGKDQQEHINDYYDDCLMRFGLK